MTTSYFKNAALGGHRGLGKLHREMSKAVFHEAFLDLWLEHNGYDIHPSEMTAEMISAYVADVVTRANLRRRADGYMEMVKGAGR